MTSTEIAVHQNGQVAERDVVDGWLSVVSEVIKLANVVADTDFVPEAYSKNAPAVAAAILTGRELGIGPMTSLRHVQIVKGTPTLSAEYKRARVLAAGHDFDVLELTTTRCKVSGRRRGSTKPALVIQFTMDDAKTAGLLAPSRSGKPGAWQTRPRRMLFARAGSELCDFLFADVVNGLPTAEVLADGSESDELPEQVQAAAPAEEPAAKPRTAQRKARTAAQDVPGPVVPDTGTAQPDPGPEGPPLPGEDDQSPPPGPDGASDANVGLIVRHFQRLGFTPEERDQRLALTSRLAGRLDVVTSTRELSTDQARAVRDTLARCKDRGKLVALLAEGDKP